MNDFFSDFKFVLPDLDDVREFLGKCLDKFAQWFDFDRIESVLRYDSNNPLLFNTGLFLLLFTAFLLLYRLLRFLPYSQEDIRNPLLTLLLLQVKCRVLLHTAWRVCKRLCARTHTRKLTSQIGAYRHSGA